MFSSVARTLGNRHVRDNDHHRASTEEPSALRARDDALIASIEALLDGRYDAVPQDANDPVSRALAKLASKLAESASQSLDRVVALNIQSNETAIAAGQLLSASREIDGRTQTLAAASEEMVASIAQIRATAEHASSEADRMRRSSENGLSTVGSAGSAMQRVGTTANEASRKITQLSEASETIGAIVGSIDAIAKQTNLLALNATIEAARAGEAGRGFAVVATEVKGLSQQTSKATEEIRARIDALRSEISSIVGAMSDCTRAAAESQKVVAELGEAVADVGNHVVSVTDGMNEIAQILNQQSSASKEIAEGIAGIADRTRISVAEVTAVSEQLDAAQGLASQQLQQLATLSFENKIPRLAKADHVIWKKRLADMAVGRARLNADELSDHHSCRLGKWYYGEDSRPYRSHPAFAPLERPHELVHEHGKRAAKLFEKGDFAGALKEIEQVGAASEEVLRLLDSLGQKAP